MILLLGHSGTYMLMTTTLQQVSRRLRYKIWLVRRGAWEKVHLPMALYMRLSARHGFR